ncbi:hypothetical protein BC936DRAFT_138859 [Jimgerdemannia flammicorona]|uniref:GH18 domain-containing protein n=1 Tax=Jimgerdemannia flammicorona TaxID=994334 RepID=A0A433BG16_9FUNG|nr:hypothetical protein BC936DRAFT_138859 [Jimgerdemannia flammicorona]
MFFAGTAIQPWSFNLTTMMFISYNDPDSLKVKVDYVNAQSLRGVMFWNLIQGVLWHAHL